MANPKKASSGSQFYIVHDPEVCRQLDGQYTVFGEVTEGLEVIDAIAGVATDRRDRPYEDVMILSIKKVEYEEPAAPADSTAVETADSTETK
jgi:cyclophilin family peptidyl-prolyl cis-trans isomerase